MYAHIAFNLQKVIFGRMSYESFDVLKINISFTKMKNSCHYVFIFVERVICLAFVRKHFNYIKYKPNCKPLGEELQCIHCYAHFCWLRWQGSTKSVLEETAV